MRPLFCLVVALAFQEFVLELPTDFAGVVSSAIGVLIGEALVRWFTVARPGGNSV